MDFRKPASRILFIGHRGFPALAPENTLPAYQVGLGLGVDFVGMDVVVTRDGEVLVSHDPVLSPNFVKAPDGNYVEPGRWVVNNLTLQELRAFDVGVLNPKLPYAAVFPDQVPRPAIGIRAGHSGRSRSPGAHRSIPARDGSRSPPPAGRR